MCVLGASGAMGDIALALFKHCDREGFSCAVYAVDLPGIHIRVRTHIFAYPHIVPKLNLHMRIRPHIFAANPYIYRHSYMYIHIYEMIYVLIFVYVYWYI